MLFQQILMIMFNILGWNNTFFLKEKALKQYIWNKSIMYKNEDWNLWEHTMANLRPQIEKNVIIFVESKIPNTENENLGQNDKMDLVSC